MSFGLQGPVVKLYEGVPPVNQELVQIGDANSNETLGTAIQNINSTDQQQNTEISALQNNPSHINLSAAARAFFNALTLAQQSNPSLNTSNIYFPDADADKPISIDYFSPANELNDITGASDGLTIDTTVGMAPAQDDALGGVALRSKFEIRNNGQETNWRRVFSFTMQLASVGGGGGFRDFFNLIRRTGNETHRTLGLVKDGTGPNIHLNARVTNPSNATQQGFYQMGVGSRTSGTQPYHFLEGDIVRFTIEFEKPNPTGSDSTQDLRLIITAHRFNSSATFLETLQFDDLSRISASDPQSNLRGYHIGFIDEWKYNDFDYYAADNASNYLLPTIFFETFQWVDTLSPRMFLRHQDLVDRSRAPISNDHRLLGFYADNPIDLLSLHAPIDFSSVTISGKAPTERVINRDVTQTASNFTDLGDNSRLTGEADDTFLAEFKSGNATATATFLLSEYTAATATETALTGNPLNRGRAIVTGTIGSDTFYLAKAPNNNLRVNSSASGDTYSIKITQFKS